MVSLDPVGIEHKVIVSEPCAGVAAQQEDYQHGRDKPHYEPFVFFTFFYIHIGISPFNNVYAVNKYIIAHHKGKIKRLRRAVHMNIQPPKG